MNKTDYTISFTVDQTPVEVFNAINHVRDWWSGEIKGDTDKLDAEFTYRYDDIHLSKQKIVEFIPNKKIVWHVLEGYLNFVEKEDEWAGTDIIFDITEEDGKTKVTFTHKGLTPAVECYDSCSSGWNSIISNLQKYISTKKVPSDPFKSKVE